MIDKNFWSGKRVLVTGHTGFKGSWLTLLLLELGANVYGYSLEPDSISLFQDLSLYLQSKQEFNHTIGDIVDLNSISQCVKSVQPEVVFHLAAQPLVRASYDDPIGTWNVNVIGTLNLLESLKTLAHKCSVVVVTTDKVYMNREWLNGYREDDRLGGHDPYSASKAAVELLVDSWRNSFCAPDSLLSNKLFIATARAGNVIGGGDWSQDRIVPDTIRAIKERKAVQLRNPSSTRPWQHVLEPLSGYMKLAQRIYGSSSETCKSVNFGPHLESNQSVKRLVLEIFSNWQDATIELSPCDDKHEANLLHLQIDKAFHLLDWKPRYDFAKTIQVTVDWYAKQHNQVPSIDCCLHDIFEYLSVSES